MKPKKRNLFRIVLIVAIGALVFKFYIDNFIYTYHKIIVAGSESSKPNAVIDCGIVLTGGPGRIQDGFSLISQGAVKKLIVSGVSSSSTLRDVFPMWNVYGPISHEDVILEKRSETTFGNAIQSLAIAEAVQCKDILLITSNLHLYRALMTFRNIYPSSINIETRPVAIIRQNRYSLELITEVIKTQFYALFFF